MDGWMDGWKNPTGRHMLPLHLQRLKALPWFTPFYFDAVEFIQIGFPKKKYSHSGVKPSLKMPTRPLHKQMGVLERNPFFPLKRCWIFMD